MNNPKPFASLQGKIALVTGAAAGIGAGCAKELSAAGATVILSDLNGDVCEQLALDIGTNAHAYQQDVTSESDWLKITSIAKEKFGGLDVVLNNAGVYVGGTLMSNDLATVRNVFKVNVESIFLGMKYAAETMIDPVNKIRGGSIINLSSVAGLIGVPGHSAYGATKGAVRLYSKHAAVEFARLGYDVRVNSVHPGLIDTAMGVQVYEDFVEVGLAPDVDAAKAAVEQMTPMGRIGSVQDIANIVRFLASDAASYCTGAEFVVDGGMTAT